tara:strand:+ start:344 stop:568 length:225 start_codon:yes stop_codon:yes gene_type:complete
MKDYKISNWIPKHQDNLGPISETYYLINKELEILQDKISCPDTFIYDFIDAIKKEWHPKSCKSRAKIFKKNNFS